MPGSVPADKQTLCQDLGLSGLPQDRRPLSVFSLPMTYDLPVPGYGTLRGRATENVAEFLGVPFGEIAERFAASNLASPPQGVVDCTEQGPLCPQVEPYNDDWNGVPSSECAPLDVKYDEFRCLNMRMHVPLDPETQKPLQNLPVVVWLHGGSNIAGTPYRGSSNARPWIKRGTELNRPFIVVSPHYRLGFFGFLPWKGVSNQAIGDQRLCVEWIRRYGPGFGADISRITLVGQSAGASCAYAHLLDPRTTSIVSQIAMLSGHVGSRGLATHEQYAKLADFAAENVGCSVPELATIEPRKLVGAQVDINVFAAVRPENAIDQTDIRVIVSDCEHDGDFFAQVPALVRASQKQNTDGADPEQFTRTLFTDLIFRTGANEIWQKYPLVFRQLCDAINPYTPSMGNNHMVELHYILNGYNLESPIIDAVQAVWAKLVYLESPWDPSTQALWLPPQSEPTAIDSAEAWKKRQTRPIEQREELVRLTRGWPV